MRLTIGPYPYFDGRDHCLDINPPRCYAAVYKHGETK